MRSFWEIKFNSVSSCATKRLKVDRAPHVVTNEALKAHFFIILVVPFLSHLRKQISLNKSCSLLLAAFDWIIQRSTMINHFGDSPTSSRKSVHWHERDAAINIAIRAAFESVWSCGFPFAQFMLRSRFDLYTFLVWSSNSRRSRTLK